MPLFDGLVEFVTGRGGGDDLRSFRAGQPLVTQFLLFGEVSPTAHSRLPRAEATRLPGM